MIKGHDGLTWQERRERKARLAQLTNGWYDECKKHGKQAVDPFNEKTMICGCRRPKEKAARAKMAAKGKKLHGKADA